MGADHNTGGFFALAPTRPTVAWRSAVNRLRAAVIGVGYLLHFGSGVTRQRNTPCGRAALGRTQVSEVAQWVEERHEQ
jgi:hypothetical protein